MEKKYRRSDNTNDYKSLILQIGRKYTYAGFPNLHIPVAVFKTPEIFVFNENFHDFEIDEEEVKKICKLVSKKIKIKPVINDTNEKKPESTEKREVNIEEEAETDKETETETETGMGIKTDEEANVNIEKGEEVVNGKTEHKGEENEKGTKLRKLSSEPKEATQPEEEPIELNDIPFIYHYEYKYNQNSQLWSAFFEEYLLRIFHILTRSTTKPKKVVLILNMFVPTIIKYTLCKCLLQNSEVSSISYINDLVSPLYISNCNTCVVVDLGYIHCRVLPILNGFPLYHHYTYVDNGGVYINKEIRKMLKLQYLEGRQKYTISSSKETATKLSLSADKKGSSNVSIDEKKVPLEDDDKETFEMLNYYYSLYSQEEIEAVINELTEDDIEIIKIKYCYLKNETLKLISDKCILFEKNHYKIIIEPETRWKACEILFTKKYEHNLYSLFSKLIDKLDHLNYTVFYNVILCGGCSNIKGILSRVAQTLYENFKNRSNFFAQSKDNVKFVFPKVSPHLRQFVGASVYASLDILPEYTTEHISNNVLYNNLSEDIYINFKR